MNARFWISPLSENIIQACVDVFDDGQDNLGLIISENQVGSKGYTGFDVPSLMEYLKEKFTYVPQVWRDHSSCDREVLRVDCKYLSGIHIDPFKTNDPFKKTVDTILYCYSLNRNLKYEVGTEEAIFKYSGKYFLDFLSFLKKRLPQEVFNQVAFGVIQCGTKLKDGKNVGNFDSKALMIFLEVCKRFNLIPKEHNGDYQPNHMLSHKNNACNSNFAVNLAPEVAFVESSTVYDFLNHKEKDTLFEMCKKNPNTKKWFSKDYDYFAHKKTVVASTAHYLYNCPEFKNLIGNRPALKEAISRNLKEYLVQKILAISP